MSIQVPASMFALLLAAGSCLAAAPSETHKLRVHGAVDYRCYAGYEGKQLKDERSGEACDNQSTSKVLIDKVVTIVIADEPDPEHSRELEGGWSETVTFKGRKFTAGFNLFKSAGKVPYTISIVAQDDEPQPRQTRVSARLSRVGALNPLTVSNSSMGKKEEITFNLKVEAVK